MERGKILHIESSRKEFSSLGGLVLFDKLFSSLGPRKKLGNFLPSNILKSRVSSFDKFKALVMGFVAGAECLDDMDDLAHDSVFRAVCSDKLSAPTTYGDYLRSFDPWQVRFINEQLIDAAHALRKRFVPNAKEFILDVDSTDHQQYGKKMEGVRWHRNHFLCLSSLQAFDQYGFQYWMEVREGCAFTANGAPTAIRKIFKKVPRNQWRYLRADSGYCNVDVFNACYESRVKFVIPMRANMADPLIPRIRRWELNPKVRFKDGRIAEVGSFIYRQQHGHETLRVVIMRARKQQPDMFDSDPHDYRAWITNISAGEMRDEELIDFYRGRGNSENFIRELKNGFDIHHFPCQKLLANKAYGVIAAFAYNLMRAASFILNSKKLHFSKMLRFRMVNLACQVVRKARTITIRLSTSNYKEVQQWMGVLHPRLSG
jgi:hypothetical protein